MTVKPGHVLLAIIILCLYGSAALGQACTTLGQTPSTAFPVCGTTTFVQNNVPICSTTSLFVPGCSGGGGANYANKNPFWYKFTCYTAGTLGFTITPKDAGDDYDWQLYDVTGLDPDEVFTNQNIIVSGNWAGNPGPTGTSANGSNTIQCASAYNGTEPRFAKMPNLIAGHEYILLVSHYTDSQSGYSLSFSGGTAVITDPTEPHLQKATPSCDGSKLVVKLNKKMRCSSLTSAGTEFSISPAVTTIVSALATNCSSAFDFDELTLTLAAPLPSGDYQLVINEGSDDNTVLDNCLRGIPVTEQTPFSFFIPQPIPIDSVGAAGCAPNFIKLYFSKKIDCSTISADGSNFSITGPTPVNIASATGNNCTDGFSDIVVIRFTQPIYTQGLYMVIPKLSVNGGAVRDECGEIIQPLPVSFSTVDTVSAAFSTVNQLGCRQDTLTFSHDGAHGVTNWNWLINSETITSPSHTVILPATSSNTVQLIVTNGTCSDTSATTLTLDNEVIANFEMTDIICPEDLLMLTNTSTGLIDTWRWDYGVLRTSSEQNPVPYLFPNTNIEANHIIKLVASNTSIGCSDSISKVIKVLKSCYIAVPTAFTPNGDGLNDFLYPTNALKADNLQFKVYNRWGQLVFSSRNWQDKWDGKIGGLLQATGVYAWFLEYTHRDTGKKVFQKGTTTLIR